MESNYYRPYLSDSSDSEDSGSELGSELGSESDTDTRSEASYINTLPNFKDFALHLNSESASGPNFTDISAQVFYSQPKVYSLYNTAYENSIYSFPSSIFIDKTQQANLLSVQKQQITSIINIDSVNRDKTVYPQPTNVVLRLPRIYRNIINFQIVQMKLLSAFFYFRLTKQNISIPINEQSRYLDSNGNVVTGSNVTDSNFYKVPNVITTTIREGSYDINGLINELNLHLNTPPIFYDFINGITDFIKLFQSTGDYGVGFNLPGDYFYDSVLNQFFANPTLDYIVTRYFQTRLAGQTSYTINQMTIAYYYPVLKEILLDDNYTGMPISFSSANQSLLNSTETPYTRCVYYFQGLDDQYVFSVINTNISVLDAYRLAHTFRYSLVNKYSVTYDTFNNRVLISAPSLNTSLSNTIVAKSNTYFNQQLASNKITYSNYLTIQAQNTANLIILTDMYNFLQTEFAVNFGVDFNTFSLDYFGSMSNYANIRNGSNAIVSSNYDTNVIEKNLAPLSNNLIQNYQTEPPHYWPLLASNDRANYPSGANYSNYGGSPFNLITSIPETYHTLLSNGSLYMNRLLNSVDAVVDIEPASYTVFQFKSNLRQTLQVETTPRPTKYRYPEYNATAYDASFNFFSTSILYVSDSRNSNLVDPTISVTPLPGFDSIGQSNFGITLSNSYALWSNSFGSISQVFPRDFYSFIPPYPNTLNATTQAFKYNLTINVSAYPQGSTFPIDTDLFLYHDIGAFYADISGNFNESEYNYLSSNFIPAGTTSFDITFQAFQTLPPIQTYYILFRSDTVSPIAIDYVITPYFQNSTYTELSNDLTNFNPLVNPQTNLNNWLYARAYDSNYVALPSYSNIYEQTPYANPYFTDLSYKYVSIGYDSNNVSTDLTDYIGYVQNDPSPALVPNALLRIDPITGYIFRAQSAYNSTTQTYLYSNSLNKIYTSNSATLYTPTTVSFRNFTQAHYYGTNYLPNSINQPQLNCNISPYVLPFTQTSFTNTLSNYTFNIYGNIDLGNGIYGLSLIPGEGTWDLQKYMFKSIFTESLWSDPNPLNYQSDPNLNISFLGVFFTTSLINRTITTIQLSNAIVKLGFSRSVLYNGANTNYGFGSDGGTYYEFVKQSGTNLYGYTENTNSITTDYNNTYTVLAFDSQSNVLPFVGVAGSLVPYPFYSDAVASNAYLDGTTTSNGASLIVPLIKSSPDLTRGPSSNGAQTQAQYEQSMPIGTTFQMYANRYSLLSSNSMYNWSNLPSIPDAIFQDVPGYMMTQNSEFKIYSYDLNSSNREFSFVKSFTIDEFFNYNTNISLMEVTGNSSEYVFLGFSNDPTFTVGDSILIKSYNPATDSLTTRVTSSWIFSLGGKVASNTDVSRFTYNDFGGYTISYTYYDPAKVSYIYALARSNSANYTLCSNVSTSDPVTLSHYAAYQHPTEFNGEFYITSVDLPSGFNTLSKILPNTILTAGEYATYTTNRPTGISAQINGSSSYVKVFDYFISPTLEQFAIVRAPVQDILYGFTSNNPTYFYQITSFSAGTNPYDSNANLTQNGTAFSNSIQEMAAGYNGALWFVDVLGNIYGNRYTNIDVSLLTLTIAWQLFYPVQRVIYKNVSKTVNTIRDLSGLTFPEFPHTQIFAYSNDASFTADISGNASIAPWGGESSSNFIISDVNYSGVYFNAYTKFIPLESNATPYYVAVRNYSPTEKSQVYMRFSLPKRYDFGYAKFSDISNEVVLLASNSNSFNPNYAAQLKQFNNDFIFTSKTFGANVVSGYEGVTLSNVTGFGDFMRYYTTIYNNYVANITLINTINSNTSVSLSNFIATDLQYIIPPTATNRQKYTDPLLFSIFWKSQLTPQYAKLEENWGLGYNLGYNKEDTDYDLIHRAESFYKILDDYINLRMNQEFDFNRVDITAKENLSQTLESTGGTKQFYGKLLLANFGSYAQTMVMNPISFNPPLGRLDKLHFSWVDNTNQIIDNADCEWNAVIQIVEMVDTVQIPEVPLLNPR